MKPRMPYMENLEDIFPGLSQFNDNRNGMLRTMFGKYIKPNFMIRVKEEIIHSSEFNELMPQCYSFNLSPILALGVDDIDFDICSNLAMINYYLMLSISDNEELKSKRYKSDEYKTELKNRVIMQCKLRQLIQNFEERNFLLAFVPINFSMHCIVNFMLDKIDKNIKAKNRPAVPNANFKINTLVLMLKTIKSMLILIECNDCGNAFSLLRTTIEALFVYFSIYDNEGIAEEYYKFMGYREMYEATGQYPNEFERIVPLDCNKQNYLNYGWIDKLNNKYHKYVFSEVVACNTKIDENEKESYLSTYKYCCKFAHGNYLNQGISNYSFIWILHIAGAILVNVARQFAHIFQESTAYNGVDLEEYLIKNVEEAAKIFNELKQQSGK